MMLFWDAKNQEVIYVEEDVLTHNCAQYELMPCIDLKVDPRMTNHGRYGYFYKVEMSTTYKSPLYHWLHVPAELLPPQLRAAALIAS